MISDINNLDFEEKILYGINHVQKILICMLYVNENFVGFVPDRNNGHLITLKQIKLYENQQLAFDECFGVSLINNMYDKQISKSKITSYDSHSYKSRKNIYVNHIHK